MAVQRPPPQADLLPYETVALTRATSTPPLISSDGVPLTSSGGSNAPAWRGLLGPAHRPVDIGDRYRERRTWRRSPPTATMWTASTADRQLPLQPERAFRWRFGEEMAAALSRTLWYMPAGPPP